MKKPGHISFHFVPFPCSIWDDSIDLSLAEFRLLGYLLRLTYRFGKSTQIRLSDQELMRGRKDQSGAYLDRGCGLKNRASIRAARLALLEKGWIECEENTNDPARIKRFYSLLFSPDEQTPHAQKEEKESSEDNFDKEKTSMNSGVIDSITHLTDSIRQTDRFYTPDLQNLSPDHTREGIQERVFSKPKPRTPSAHAAGGLEKPPKTAQPPPTSPAQANLPNPHQELSGAELEKYTAFSETVDCRAAKNATALWLELAQKFPQALQLALLLASSVKINYPATNRPKLSAFTKWVQEIQRLHAIDGHDWQLIEDVLCWSQHDTFWSGNILSGPTLRRQWDKLAAKYQSKPQSRQHRMTIGEIEAVLAAHMNGGSHGDETGNPEDDGAIEAEFQSIFGRDGLPSAHGVDE